MTTLNIAAQFKNYKQFSNLAHHLIDFDHYATWIFSASGHGKSVKYHMEIYLGTLNITGCWWHWWLSEVQSCWWVEEEGVEKANQQCENIPWFYNQKEVQDHSNFDHNRGNRQNCFRFGWQVEKFPDSRGHAEISPLWGRQRGHELHPGQALQFIQRNHEN